VCGAVTTGSRAPAACAVAARARGAVAVTYLTMICLGAYAAGAAPAVATGVAASAAMQAAASGQRCAQGRRRVRRLRRDIGGYR